MLIVAAVHAFASFATRKQRALIHELELVAFALFLPSCLCRTRSNLACTFPELKNKDKRKVSYPRIKRSLVSSENGPGELQHASTC